MNSNTTQARIGLVFYPGMTALDVIGPQTVFSALPDVKIHRIWKTADPIRCDDGMAVTPDTTFADCPPLDVLCVGGGLHQAEIENDCEVLDFLARQGKTARWAMRDLLAGLGVEVGTERVVVDRNRMTGGGVTAGIDFGLAVAAALRGERAAKLAQLAIEYNPAP